MWEKSRSWSYFAGVKETNHACGHFILVNVRAGAEPKLCFRFPALWLGCGPNSSCAHICRFLFTSPFKNRPMKLNMSDTVRPKGLVSLCVPSDAGANPPESCVFGLMTFVSAYVGTLPSATGETCSVTSLLSCATLDFFTKLFSDLLHISLFFNENESRA